MKETEWDPGLLGTLSWCTTQVSTPGQVSDGEAQGRGEVLSMTGKPCNNLMGPQSTQISDQT